MKTEATKISKENFSTRYSAQKWIELNEDMLCRMYPHSWFDVFMINSNNFEYAVMEIHYYVPEEVSLIVSWWAL